MINKSSSLALAFLISGLLQVQAQEQRRPPGAAETGSSRGSMASSVPSSASASISSRGIAGSPSSTQVNSMSRSSPGFSTPGVGGIRGGSTVTPRLEGTSFNSYNSYWSWQNFMWQLQERYMLNPAYFRRFYRNSEPLLTPDLLKVSIRDPLGASSRLVQAVEELQAILERQQQGSSVTRNEISEKTKEIRDLAKKIRNDRMLSFVDQRQSVDLTKGKKLDRLGFDAIEQLHELALGLNSQLYGLFIQKSTSTVSVSTLTEPSFDSISKSIEKLSKVIEKSARGL